MVNLLTPKSICTDVANGKIHKALASELLISLIEGSDDHIMRAESIKAFEIVGVKAPNSFKIFENTLLSDESQIVRSASLNLIAKNYLNKGKNSIKWVIQYDRSPLLMKNLINLSNDLTIFPKNLKELISRRFHKIASQLGLLPFEAKFILELEALFSTNQKKSILRTDIYKKYTKLRNLNGNYEWLNIKKRSIIALSFNYFSWKFLRNNSEKLNSISKLNYPDVYLNKLKDYSKNGNVVTIPESINNLSNLRILDLSNNNLKEIPQAITSLKRLHTLDLSHNNISTIPKEIKNLNSLKNLILSENQIHSIPHSLNGFLNSLENFKYL
jgi:Leucine-rich repeat (LRR) protein